MVEYLEELMDLVEGRISGGIFDRLICES